MIDEVTRTGVSLRFGARSRGNHLKCHMRAINARIDVLAAELGPELALQAPTPPPAAKGKRRRRPRKSR